MSVNLLIVGRIRKMDYRPEISEFILSLQILLIMAASNMPAYSFSRNRFSHVRTESKIFLLVRENKGQKKRIF